eukprot:gene8564-9267_t
MSIHPPFIHSITKKVYETSNGEKEGWLKKESAWFKFWNKRFCVLKGLNLFYADGENNPPHGMVSLIQCQRIQRVDHLVMLLKSPKGLFRFRATSEQEFEEWFKLIDAIQYAYANGRLGIRNYVKALQLSQQSYDKFHQLFGDYHPLTVICKYYLGCMYFMQGEYEQSYEILQESYEKILQLCREGEEKEASLHSILIDLLCVFAIVQQRRGITTVSWMYEMALRKSRELYGEHHQKTLTVIEAYAQFHDSQGDLENAIISMEDCLKQRQVLYDLLKCIKN